MLNNRNSAQEKLLDNLSVIAAESNSINTALYEQYNVKRGLRNADSTGVLVGLTEIGDVHGYIIDESEKIPVEGRLRYRGIDVSDIVEGLRADRRFGFEEVSYLLVFGELPTEERLTYFREMLDANRTLPDGFTENMVLKAPSSNIMNKLARAILASYSYDDNPEEISVRNVLRQSIEMIARFPTMCAYGYQAKSHYYEDKSLFIHKPEPGLSTAENFLRLIRPDMSFTPLEAEILDLCFILHAEHGGGNNSTFATRVVTSSGTDTYSALSAAVGSLKGPKHGGANARVMNMMDFVKENVKKWDSEGEVADVLTKIVRKEAFDRSGLIYGMGHAVYTVSDPRAVILKRKAEELAKEKGSDDEMALFELVERLSPEVFTRIKGDSGKVIAANVDFYSGFVYSMLDIPADLFTPIFAMSRVPGWCAHRIEEIVSGGRIIRPAYKNVMKKRLYIPMDQRQ